MYDLYLVAYHVYMLSTVPLSTLALSAPTKNFLPQVPSSNTMLVPLPTAQTQSARAAGSGVRNQDTRMPGCHLCPASAVSIFPIRHPWREWLDYTLESGLVFEREAWVIRYHRREWLDYSLDYFRRARCSVTNVMLHAPLSMFHVPCSMIHVPLVPCSIHVPSMFFSSSHLLISPMQGSV